jgi:hypothetical protein
MFSLALRAMLVVVMLSAESASDLLAQGLADAERNRVQVGAIRWDNWRLGSSAATALDHPALRPRVPYYAMRLTNGSLALPGDTEHVADADVHYARAAGIDYFIFGYYLATASWGRDPAKAAALNRAFDAYLRLRDHLNVGFAVSFNWNFPPSDVPAASDVIIHALAQSDYVRTRDRAAVVFFFVPNLTAWIAGFGGEAGATQAILQLRQQVRQAAGSNLYLVALLFGLPQVGPTAMRVGFDAVSTYANALGIGGHAVPYARCAALEQQFWDSMTYAAVGGFLPTVTLGWDYRPAMLDPAEATRPRNPDWCEPATDSQWAGHLHAATAASDGNPRNQRFPSIVLYAWNEFLEGGWIEPTLTEGVRRISVIANALGRHHAIPPFAMAWPARVDPQRCHISAETVPTRDAGAGCREINDPMTMDWPCPPGMRAVRDLLRPGSADDAALRPGIWQERWCGGE